MHDPSIADRPRRDAEGPGSPDTTDPHDPVEELEHAEERAAGEHETTFWTRSKRERKRSFWRELPVMIVIAFAVALVIKTFLLQAFYIPSASMQPTLREGDRVLVEKVGYRFGEPDRGDVVVFERDLGFVRGPEDDESLWEDVINAFKSLFGFPTGTSQDFIKRVIAVEGDEVEAKGGRVIVNGRPIDEPYLTAGVETASFGPVDVPSGHIFVMGDNRNNSDDSRNFGPVSAGKVVGHAFVLIWPPADLSVL